MASRPACWCCRSSSRSPSLRGQTTRIGCCRCSWQTALLHDQRVGAGIAWASGYIPTSLLLTGVAMLWARSSEREARRTDRQADATATPTSTPNTYLAALADRAHRPSTSDPPMKKTSQGAARPCRSATWS